MRRRSLTGPLLLLVIGGLFLWRNLHPEAPIFDIVSLYWPFLLIAWGLLRLAESVFWWQRGHRVGFGGGEVVLIVFICAVGWGFWQAREHGSRFINGMEIWANQYDYPVSARGSAEGVTRIVFENPRGNIKVTGGDGTEVVVTGRKLVRAWAQQDADRINGDTPVELVPQGDRLLIRSNQDRVSHNRSVSDDLEVVVPRGVAVEARNGSGDYELSDIGGDVELATGRGDVRLARLGGNARLDVGRSDLIRATDVKGNVDLQGSGVDLDVENVAGQVTINGSYRGSLDFKNLAKPLNFEGRETELHVQAVPGRISMDLGEFSGKDLVGPVRLMAHSRDVKLEQFTQSLELESDRGDIQLIPGRTPLSSIEARSGSGRIDLALPPKAAFQLTATAEEGDAVNDFGPPIQKEVVGRTATLTGKVGEGPTIRLTASRGWISVRKEGTPSSLTGDAPETPPAPEAPKAPKAPKAKGTEI